MGNPQPQRGSLSKALPPLPHPARQRSLAVKSLVMQKSFSRWAVASSSSSQLKSQPPAPVLSCRTQSAMFKHTQAKPKIPKIPKPKTPNCSPSAARLCQGDALLAFGVGQKPFSHRDPWVPDHFQPLAHADEACTGQAPIPNPWDLGSSIPVVSANPICMLGLPLAPGTKREGGSEQSRAIPKEQHPAEHLVLLPTQAHWERTGSALGEPPEPGRLQPPGLVSLMERHQLNTER